MGSEVHAGKRSGRNTLSRKKSEELRAKLFRVDDEFVEIVFDDARGDFLLDDAEFSFSKKPEAGVEGAEREDDQRFKEQRFRSEFGENVNPR